MRTHGDCRYGTITPEYRAWNEMHRRCLGKYRGRGIIVCERWHTFESFLADMGRRPSADHSVDRINNAGDYDPDNCRWATREEQARNRSSNLQFTHDGRTLCLTEWCALLGLNYKRTRDRVVRFGWSFERAISPQTRSRKVTPELKRLARAS